ncbi:MAG: zinc ribbon domain-containing protein [bacterium]|nr:zinc ribbon domain-containing protein [bacterium]
MPTYEFECKKCDYKFEVFTSISEKKHTKCPKCGSSKLTQILGSFFLSGVKDTSSSGCETCKTPTCATCPISKQDTK